MSLQKTILSIFLLIFIACKKESTSTLLPDQSSASDQSSLNTQSLRLILQPGPEDGDDAYVSRLVGDSNSSNVNTGQVTQLEMEAWTINLKYFFARSYIKFDSLSKIPPTAKVTSAHLYLYGTMDSSITPQGNSVYPGSPRTANNFCIINRVRSDWNENTITWNNAPNRYTGEGDTIPRSTSNWNYNVDINVRDLVRPMVANSANYGFCIRLIHEGVYRSMVFASSENPDPSKRPKLVVNYQLP